MSKGVPLCGLGIHTLSQSTLTHLLEEPLEHVGGGRAIICKKIPAGDFRDCPREPYLDCGFSYAYVPVIKFNSQMRRSKKLETGKQGGKEPGVGK